MASLLRSLVAGPRLQHDEAGLDLCYVSLHSPTIIAMSMPAITYPKRAYRNPQDRVLSFLQARHGERWRIWEFRAEGTGYDDTMFGGRVEHAPFPDHHPPPFVLVPKVVEGMKKHLEREGGEGVVVVHCKAGKGRSGTMSCAYLITEHAYTADTAMAQFTLARMRPGFGEGVSIPSQRRWLRYVEAWAHTYNRVYTPRSVRIRSIHVWGLRAGVRVAVRSFVDGGKRIETFHEFRRAERKDMQRHANSADVILEPASPLILPGPDVNIDFERRSNGLAVVVSVAHVWWNAFFESSAGKEENGVFEIAWEKMDGIKGTTKKGMQALDRVQVVWSFEDGEEPGTGEEPPLKIVEVGGEDGELELVGREEVAGNSGEEGGGVR